MESSTARPPEALIVAAEASSALYAKRLLEHWRGSENNVKAFGIGTRDMEALGFEVLGRSEELAVVGLQEVISNFGLIRRTFNSLVSEAKKRRPKFILLLDYPDFNLRLAKKLKPLGIPIIYYISPQVWAWRKSRLKHIKKYVDKMLCLFPFEKKFYEESGIDVDFVGHPLLDEIEEEYFDPKLINDVRQRHGIENHEVVLGLMPGSRRSEIKYNLKTQLEVAEKLSSEVPGLKVILLIASTFSVEEFRSFMPDLNFSLALVQDDPFKMLRLTDAVLCASGTATLVVGLMKKPMIIMYKVNPVTGWLAKFLVKGTPFFGMINLIFGKKVVEEYFQEEASVPHLSERVKEILVNKSKRDGIIKELSQARSLLGERGATQRVVTILDSYFQQQKSQNDSV